MFLVQGFLEPLFYRPSGNSTNTLDIPTTQGISEDIPKGSKDLWNLTSVKLAKNPTTPFDPIYRDILGTK